MRPERSRFVCTALSASVEADGAERGSDVCIGSGNEGRRLSDLGHFGDLECPRMLSIYVCWEVLQPGGTYDERRDDQSNGDTVVLDFLCNGFSPRGEESLGSRIGSEERGRDSGTEGSDVEDETVLVLDHLREDELRDGECRIDVLRWEAN